MVEYYFDIETYTACDRPDPKTDKIITIQYQELAPSDGHPISDLRILTEWDYKSEKQMLQHFKEIFLAGSPFDFIPVGVNLYGFDLISIIHRLNHHFNLNLGYDLFRDRPVIDIKPVLVIMNKGIFRGYTQFLGKKEAGNMIKSWYDAGDHQKIIEYIQTEAQSFINRYQLLKKELPQLLLK